MDIRRLRKIEWLIPIAVIILCVIGLVALYSASYDTNLEEFKKQAIWIGISFVLMLIVMLIDYKILVKVSPIFYGISIIMLIAVLFTKPINGARSWFVIGDDLFSFPRGKTMTVVNNLTACLWGLWGFRYFLCTIWS